MEKKFSKGLVLLMSFTGGKLIEDTSQTVAFLGAAPTHQNIYDLRSDRSLASQDVSRRMVLSYIYSLPVGRGQAFGTNLKRPLDLMIGNWQINGILTLSTGIPLSIIDAQNNSQSFSAGQRPNVSGQNAQLDSGRSTTDKLARWFDIGTFSQPAAYTFGNGPRVMPNVRGDGVRQWDSSIFKSFPIHESIRVEFRFEMFNSTNTPNFALPGQTFGNALFGVVGGQRNAPRQVQFGLKLYY